MQIWFVRIACLMKLKLFKEADEELKQFGDFDQAHFYFEFEQTGQQSRKGNVCNWEFIFLDSNPIKQQQ